MGQFYQTTPFKPIDFMSEVNREESKMVLDELKKGVDTTKASGDAIAATIGELEVLDFDNPAYKQRMEEYQKQIDQITYGAMANPLDANRYAIEAKNLGLKVQKDIANGDLGHLLKKKAEWDKYVADTKANKELRPEIADALIKDQYNNISQYTSIDPIKNAKNDWKLESGYKSIVEADYVNNFFKDWQIKNGATWSNAVPGGGFITTTGGSNKIVTKGELWEAFQDVANGDTSFRAYWNQAKRLGVTDEAKLRSVLDGLADKHSRSETSHTTSLQQLSQQENGSGRGSKTKEEDAKVVFTGDKKTIREIINDANSARAAYNLIKSQLGKVEGITAADVEKARLRADRAIRIQNGVVREYNNGSARNVPTTVLDKLVNVSNTEAGVILPSDVTSIIANRHSEGDRNISDLQSILQPNGKVLITGVKTVQVGTEPVIDDFGKPVKDPTTGKPLTKAIYENQSYSKLVNDLDLNNLGFTPEQYQAMNTANSALEYTNYSNDILDDIRNNPNSKYGIYDRALNAYRVDKNGPLLTEDAFKQYIQDKYTSLTEIKNKINQ